MKRLLPLILFILVIPELAKAATVTWFVNTDCANNGDGTASTCAGSPGGAGALTTLDNAITKIVATIPNFVTSTTQGVINLRGATVDTSIPSFAGITTNIANSLTLTVDVVNRWPGYRDTTKYTIKNAHTLGVIQASTKAITINGLQVISTSNVNADENIPIRSTASNDGGMLVVTNNYVGKEGTGNSVFNHGIFMSGNGYITSGTFKAANNFVYGMAGTGIRCVTGTAVSCFIYSNTARNNVGAGINSQLSFVGSVGKYRNNLGYGNTGVDWLATSTGGTLTTSTNVTEDATSPDGVGFVSQTVTFGPQSIDGRITAAASGATDKGTDLSADANFAFSTDFIGTTRPQGSAWDVGANEMIGTGPPAFGVGGRFLGLGVGQ